MTLHLPDAFVVQPDGFPEVAEAPIATPLIAAPPCTDVTVTVTFACHLLPLCTVGASSARVVDHVGTLTWFDVALAPMTFTASIRILVDADTPVMVIGL